MTPVLLLGVGAGVGLVLAARGLHPAPPPLAAVVHRLDRTADVVAHRRANAPNDGRAVRIGRLRSGRVVVGLSARLGRRAEADLEIMERTPGTFAVEKLSTALALGGIVLVLAVVLAMAGAPLPLGCVFALFLGSLGVGFITPDLTLRAHAASRRSSFRHALSSYLDLVNVLLAGGAGIETSLVAAAQSGDGWAFNQLRNSLVRARTMRRSPWECFTELGERLAIDELSEIAASVQLAGEQGARVKRSLAAKAAALRGHQMARVEADAQAATERMGVPTVLMFVGFMALLGYPALQQIVTAL